MSKTITIPAGAGNRVTIILNGKSYELPTGVEISVPDEVAALLSANEEMAPQTGREPMPWNDGQGGGSGGGGGGGSGVDTFDVTLNNNNELIMPTGKTVADLLSAFQDGQIVRLFMYGCVGYVNYVDIRRGG